MVILGDEPAPAVAVDRWYYVFGERVVGPFASKDLQALVDSGALTPTTLVRREDQASWSICREVGVFTPADTETVGSAPVPPPVPSSGESGGDQAVLHIPAGSIASPRPAPAPPAAPARTSGLAIASLVLAVAGWPVCLGSVLAVIFGAVALERIEKSHGRVGGRAMAVAGMILGILGMLGFVALALGPLGGRATGPGR